MNEMIGFVVCDAMFPVVMEYDGQLSLLMMMLSNLIFVFVIMFLISSGVKNLLGLVGRMTNPVTRDTNLCGLS